MSGSVTWSSWLEEPVCWSGGERVSRATALRLFVEEGLIPFLKGNGYRVAPSVKLLRSRIATGLWINRGRSCLDSNWAFGHELQRGWRQEDLYRFEEVLDDDAWDSFWAAWACWSDIDDSSERGQDRRIDIREYVWSQLDLRASPQTAFVNEILGTTEDSEDGWRAGAGSGAGEDTYLREQAESGEVGGYRRPKP